MPALFCHRVIDHDITTPYLLCSVPTLSLSLRRFIVFYPKPAFSDPDYAGIT
jgi:hypothetical protein